MEDTSESSLGSKPRSGEEGAVEKAKIAEELLDYVSASIAMPAMEKREGSVEEFVTAPPRVQRVLDQYLKQAQRRGSAAGRATDGRGFLQQSMDELMAEAMVRKPTEAIRKEAFDQKVSLDHRKVQQQTEHQHQILSHLPPQQPRMMMGDEKTGFEFLQHKPVDMVALHRLLVRMRDGEPLSSAWVKLYECLHIRPRKQAGYDRKTVLNNVNYKLKNLLITRHWLRFYGDDSCFSLSILSQLPDVLIVPGDRNLRDAIRILAAPKRPPQPLSPPPSSPPSAAILHAQNS